MKLLYESEKELFPIRINLLSPVEIGSILLNIAIGTGWLKLGYGWRCGEIFSLVLSVVFALLSFYAIWMFIEVIRIVKMPTFEMIAVKIWNKKVAFVILFFSLVETIIGVMFVLEFIKDYFLILLGDVIKVPAIVENYIVSAGIATVLCILIGCLIVNIRVLSIYSYIQNFCVLFIICGCIYWCIVLNKEDGFNAQKQMKLFEFNEQAVSLVSSLLTAYLIVPLSYPSPEHVKHATVSLLKKIFGAVFVILAIVYALMGTVSYLTFFDDNEGDLLLDLYPKCILTTCMEYALLIAMILHYPVIFNSGRQLIITFAVGSFKKVNKYMWISLGILLSILSFIIGGIRTVAYDLICLACDFASPILLFSIPGILYLSVFKFKNCFHAIGAIFVILVGLVGAGFMIYSYLPLQF